jgi:hypothetical protein
MMKNAIVLGAMLLSFVACKKEDPQPDDNNNNNSGNNKSSILTSGTWKLAASHTVLEYEGRTESSDLFAAMPQCMRDNIYTFNKDNTATLDEGASKCSPTDPQQRSAGTWALSQNDTKLKMTENGAVVNADVLTLNSTTLEVKYVVKNPGVNATTTTTTRYGR